LILFSDVVVLSQFLIFYFYFLCQPNWHRLSFCPLSNSPAFRSACFDVCQMRLRRIYRNPIDILLSGSPPTEPARSHHRSRLTAFIKDNLNMKIDCSFKKIYLLSRFPIAEISSDKDAPYRHCSVIFFVMLIYRSYISCLNNII